MDKKELERLRERRRNARMSKSKARRIIERAVEHRRQKIAVDRILEE